MDTEKQGYLGKLEDKSISELQELLARQENILKKTKFVSNLPDKGKKINQFRQKLIELISEKERLVSGTSQPRGNTPTKKQLDKNPNIKPTSKFSAVSKDKVFSAVKNEDTPVSENVLRDVVTMANKSGGLEADKQDNEKFPLVEAPQTAAQTCITSDFSNLRDKSVQGRIKNDRGAITETREHCNRNNNMQETLNVNVGDVTLLEKAMENMDIDPCSSTLGSEELKNKILENSTKFAPYFKANSFLKIHNVQELPDKYKWKSRQGHPIKEENTSVSCHSEVKDESAATPPIYKYEAAQLISLNESMQLQQTQQRHQEELQARTAAERLAKSLKIKMEPYNPEGRNMANPLSYMIIYRLQVDQMDTDSDDEQEVEFYPDAVD
ncbi:DNA-directed RNA polymerase II subunit GRINL1A-like [Saccostrea echinata]|uniref:DNA-directed RNA polymerase II subunit GRINL1A-like n=1 Tax=Saccostrea echinata TaxID=191078 RepID=UPI002A7FD2D8|nr:DNA-directed RNA polymerase II subunit GRINL1A-like [Saccostrea echinata]